MDDDRHLPAETPVPESAEEAAGLLMRLHRFETVELVQTLDLLEQISSGLGDAYREADGIRAALSQAGPELRSQGMGVLAQRLSDRREARAAR